MERDKGFRTLSTYILTVFLVIGAVQKAAAQTGVPEGYSETLRWYHERAAAGDPRAQFLLAVKYETGTDVARDMAKARELYIQAARQGHADAQFKAGTLAQAQATSDAQSKVAQDWYQAAAVQGHGPAQYNLAVMLANAGRDEDEVIEAASWAMRAAETGLPQAQLLRDALLVQMSPEAVAEARRLAKLSLQP